MWQGKVGQGCYPAHQRSLAEAKNSLLNLSQFLSLGGSPCTVHAMHAHCHYFLDSVLGPGEGRGEATISDFVPFRCRSRSSRCPPTKRNKIRNGCLSPAFSKAQNRVEMLCHPYIRVDCHTLTPARGATQQSMD